MSWARVTRCTASSRRDAGGGATPLEAAIVANYAAGVEVAKSGAATASAAEVLDAYDAHAAGHPK